MDFKAWNRRYMNSLGGNYQLTYKAYKVVDGNYELEEEISRQDFEQHRQSTSKIYDMNNHITIRPSVTNPNEGFFEYSSKVKDERPSEVDEACLKEFIKEYNIIDRNSLEELLDLVDASNIVYKLKALTDIPSLIKKFQ